MLLDGDGDVHNDDEDDNGNDDAATEVQTINLSSQNFMTDDGGTIYNFEIESFTCALCRTMHLVRAGQHL